ncbi:twin-arginine translocation signal domain-containing protein [Streptomyces sp. NBC_00076]|uniref:twin-arginine translocation signal domain-containing protein n=1 Tax=Streptomyces sp. NBC_00076 TaxID=2975642 RepID=UPI0032459B07
MSDTTQPTNSGPAPQVPLSRRGFVAAASAGTAAAVGLPGLGLAVPPASATSRDSAPVTDPAAFTTRRFTDPPKDSRPTVYWYWNGPVTPELVDRQLADLRDKGMYEVILFSPTRSTTRRRPRSGSPPPATCTRSTSGRRSPAVTSSPPSTWPDSRPCCRATRSRSPTRWAGSGP